MAENGKLSTKQEQFVQCLLAHHTVAASAKLCKIGDRTAYRWHRDPAVMVRLREARRESYASTMEGLVSLVSSAIVELAKVLKDDEAGHGLKLRAVQLILEHAHMHMIDGEVDERLARIEQAFEDGD